MAGAPARHQHAALLLLLRPCCSCCCHPRRLAVAALQLLLPCCSCRHVAHLNAPALTSSCYCYCRPLAAATFHTPKSSSLTLLLPSLLPLCSIMPNSMLMPPCCCYRPRGNRVIAEAQKRLQYSTMQQAALHGKVITASLPGNLLANFP